MCVMNSLLYVPFHSVGLFFISLIVLSFITYYSTPAPFSYGTVSMLQKCYKPGRLKISNWSAYSLQTEIKQIYILVKNLV